MKVNGHMFVLAREIRGMTQAELARKSFTSQATIARIEAEQSAEVVEERIFSLAKAVDFPVSFFQQNEDLLGFGSSAYFYRKKAGLSAVDRKRIHGIVNVLRIILKKLLDAVEIVPKRPLPVFEIEQYGGSPTRVAQALRAFWNTPDGPIANLTNLIESAGVIVVPCDFGTTAMDATSLRLTEMPPLIFINKDIPGDRWRFTLAHELAHLVMHQVPHDQMEEEADEFASEFLLPEIEMKSMFSRLAKVRLVDLINVKPYWKVSVAALIERAYRMGFADANARRYLWSSLKRIGYPSEPNPIEREQAKNHQNMLAYFLNELGYSTEELAAFFRIKPQDLGSWHGPSLPSLAPRGTHLRSVPVPATSIG